MHQLERQPLAEAELNKMYVKHKYATKYLKKQITRVGATVTKGYSHISGSYEIDEAYMSSYNELPGIFIWNNGYDSYVFCFSDINTAGVDCSASSHDYVLTLGELPDKWVNQQTGFINGEFERVLSKAFAGKKNCGRIVINGSCSSGYELYRYYIKEESETLEDFCFPAGMEINGLLSGYDRFRTIVCVDEIYKGS